jgi:hypothetical protein
VWCLENQSAVSLSGSNFTNEGDHQVRGIVDKLNLALAVEPLEEIELEVWLLNKDTVGIDIPVPSVDSSRVGGIGGAWSCGVSNSGGAEGKVSKRNLGHEAVNVVKDGDLTSLGFVTEIECCGEFVNNTLVDGCGVGVVEWGPHGDQVEGGEAQLNVEELGVPEVEVEDKVNVGPEWGLNPCVHDALWVSLLDGALKTVAEVDIVLSWTGTEISRETKIDGGSCVIVWKHRNLAGEANSGKNGC